MVDPRLEMLYVCVCVLVGGERDVNGEWDNAVRFKSIYWEESR